MTKDEKFIKKWERANKNGSTIYIIRIVLIFLIIAPLVAFFIDLAFEWDFSQKAIEETFTIRYIVSKLIVFSVVGIFTGFSSWNRGVKRYEKLKNNINS